MFYEMNKENSGRETILKSHLTELQNKINTIEERHWVTAEMNRDVFEKFQSSGINSTFDTIVKLS